MNGRALAILRADINFKFSAGVGEVGDRFTVGRPDGVAFMHAIGLGEITDCSILGGSGKHIAAGDDGGALAIGGEVDTFNKFAHVNQGRPGGRKVLADRDGHRGASAGGELVAPDLAGLFKHDRAATEGRELHVKFGEAGELLGLLRGKFVAEQIGATGAFRDKVDFSVGGPHGKNILGWVIGDIFGQTRF